MFKPLRSYISKKFTKTVDVEVEVPETEVEKEGFLTITRKTTEPRPKTRSQYKSVKVPPSERFTWFMVLLIIAVIGAIILEAIYIVVVKTFSSEIFSVITLVFGALVGAVFGQKA